MKRNHFSIAEIIKMVEQHRDIIEKRIEEERESAKNSDGFLWFGQTSDLRYYKNSHQLFAVEGTTATQMMVLEDDDGSIIVPAIIDGVVYFVYPEEGKGGFVHLFYSGKRNRWAAILTDSGWLKTNELEKTPGEIWQNITEEIIDGQNVFYPKPPGWI